MKVKLVLVKEKLKKGFPIKLSIAHNKKYLRISKFDLFVQKEEQWQANKEQIVKHTNAQELNEKINKIKNTIFETLLVINKVPENKKSVALFLKIFDNKYLNTDIVELKEEEEKGITIYECFLNKEKELREDKKFGSEAAYKNARLQLFKYISESTTFEDLNLKKLEKLNSELLNDNRSVNAVAIYFRHLKAVINRAIKHDLIDKSLNPFKNFNIKTQKTKKRALNQETLKQIFDYKTEDAEELFAIDIFKLIIYLSGINLTDLISLKKTILAKNEVEYIRCKTGKIYKYGLNEESRKILQKYANESSSEFIFKDLNGHKSEKSIHYKKKKVLKKVNFNLNKIASSLNLNCQLTTYVGRHSFANLAVCTNTDLRIIQKALGHSSIQTTEIYLDEIDTKEVTQLNVNISNLFK